MSIEPITILYIDDDPDDLLIFGETINSLYPGITILKAQSGEEGINILNRLGKEHQPYPCLIMLDMNMPKMNGKQTLQYIRSQQHWEDIPVVIFTTCSSASDIEFFKNYNTDCVTKPMSYKYMNQTIQQLFSYCNIPLDTQRINN
jgi:CheY-like chemotaxis protein